MFIAQELRKTSIAEYLLYMWQVEDIIRAYDCSLTRLRKEYISNFQLSEEQMDEEIDWWGNLINMMNQEGCREKGHLQINKIVVQSLAELHAQLLPSQSFHSILLNIIRYCHLSLSSAIVATKISTR